MKKSLLALLAACSLSVAAQPSRPFDFEVEPGCVHSKSKGTCVITNKYRDSVKCKVSVTGTTVKGAKVVQMKTVVIQPKMYEDFTVVAPTGDMFLDVRASGDCR